MKRSIQLQFALVLAFLVALPCYAFNPVEGLKKSIIYSAQEQNYSIVDVRLQVFDPSGACLLYEELVRNVDLTEEAGPVFIQEKDQKRTTNDPGLALEKIYENKVEAITGANGCVYRPNAADQRLVKFTVVDLDNLSGQQFQSERLVQAMQPGVK